MGRRQKWSGRDLIVMANATKPLTGLSDADDAVIVERMNPLFQGSHLDLTGENGVHVADERRSLKITLKFKIGATATLRYLDGIIAAGEPLLTLTGRNLGSDTSAFYGNDVALVNDGQWGGGMNPVEPTFEFTAIEGDQVHGGQRVYPV